MEATVKKEADVSELTPVFVTFVIAGFACLLLATGVWIDVITRDSRYPTANPARRMAFLLALWLLCWAIGSWPYIGFE